MATRRAKPKSTGNNIEFQNLTDKQAQFLEVYITTRSINRCAKDLDISIGSALSRYNSANVQKALKEHNEKLKEVALYNEAVIIDKLWDEYNAADAGSSVRAQILVKLGQAIGMWANVTKPTKENSNVTYNIVNYSGIQNEVEKNEKVIEAELKKDEDTLGVPEGFAITTYE